MMPPGAVVVLCRDARETPVGFLLIVQIGVPLALERSSHLHPLIGPVGNGCPLFAVGPRALVWCTLRALVAVYFVGAGHAVSTGVAKVNGFGERDALPA